MTLATRGIGLCAFVLVGSAYGADALVVLHPHPYASLADSALFGGMSLDDEFHCATFEVGAPPVPGLTLAGGSIAAPSPTTDSVDADGGPIDGSGVTGRSYASSGPAVVCTLSATALGGLPERFAFALTDAPSASSLTVTVTTGAGQSRSATLGPVGDNADNGATAEDRLITITASSGIAEVVISAGGAAFEIDHVQFEDPVAMSLSSWNQHDFDDDGGADDILWLKPSTGLTATWLMDGLSVQSSGGLPLTVPATWTFEGAGATDDTGKTFVFWRDTATGLFHVWKLSGNEAEYEGPIEDSGPVSSDWAVLAIADIDGDIDADVVLRHTSTGEVKAWLLSNHSVAAVVTLGSSAGLTFLGAGDFNGDWRSDLLWRTASNQVRGWLLTGTVGGAEVWDDSVMGGTSPIGTAWTVHAIGDMDGDGCDDLVWRNSGNGNVNVWRLAGLQKASGGAIAQNVSPNWAIEHMVDLNGDGCDDILWHHSSSHVVNGWFMDGLAKVGGGTIGQVGAGWGMCSY